MIAMGFDKMVFFVVVDGDTVDVVVVETIVELVIVVLLTSGLFDKILVKASSGLSCVSSDNVTDIGGFR